MKTMTAMMKIIFSLSVLLLGVEMVVMGQSFRSKSKRNPLFRMVHDDLTGIAPFDTNRISLQHKMKHDSRRLLADAVSGWATDMQTTKTESLASQGSRHLSDHCDYLEFEVGNCTQTEYCEQVENSLNEGAEMSQYVYSCEGDILARNYATTLVVETCFYFSSGEGGVYDASKFDDTTDNCVSFTTVDTSEGDTLDKTYTYQFSRNGPTPGIFTIGRTESPCNASDPFGPTCTTCTGASLDGQDCASCTACDWLSSNSEFDYSCLNVSPDEPFESTCDSDDDASILFFLLRADSVCAYQDLVAGNCDAVAYCDTVLIASDLEDISYAACDISGTVPIDWSMTVALDEVCYYNATGSSGPYDASVFDASQDFCYTEAETFTLSQGSITVEQWTVDLTRPVEGTIVENQPTRECTEEDYYYDDAIFLPSSCSDCEDIALTVVGMECTSACTTCPDDSFEAGEQYPSCTNLDSNMVDSCDFTDFGFIGAVVEYIKSTGDVPGPGQTGTPTVSPTDTSTDTPTDTSTDTPTMSPASGAEDLFSVVLLFGTPVLSFVWFGV